MTTAAIWIDPSRRGGRPCLMGTRLYLDHPVQYFASNSGTLAEYRDDYDLPTELTNRDILAAVAWWVLNDRSGSKHDRRIRKAWHHWAVQTWDMCWHSDYQPDPPPAMEAE